MRGGQVGVVGGNAFFRERLSQVLSFGERQWLQLFFSLHMLPSKEKEYVELQEARPAMPQLCGKARRTGKRLSRA
jgi:hypothetical protein